MKKVFVKDLTEFIGAEIEEYFFVSNLQRNLNVQGTNWLNVQISDRTGRMRAKVWSEFSNKQMLDCNQQVCLIKGRVDIYNGVPGCAITEMKILTHQEYDMGDIVERLSSKLREQYVNELFAYIEKVKDNALNLLLKSIFTERNISLMCELPADIRHHHLFNGALLVHTLVVTQIAIDNVKIHKKYMETRYGQNVDMDLLIAGALLHDIGKITEFKPFPFVQKNYQRSDGRTLDGGGCFCHVI